MSVCENCHGSGWQKVKEGVDEFGNLFEESIMCPKCYGTGNTPATNADRIRAMTDEELTQWFTPRGCPTDSHRKCIEWSCKDCWNYWLQQPAEGD